MSRSWRTMPPPLATSLSGGPDGLRPRETRLSDSTLTKGEFGVERGLLSWRLGMWRCRGIRAAFKTRATRIAFCGTWPCCPCRRSSPSLETHAAADAQVFCASRAAGFRFDQIHCHCVSLPFITSITKTLKSGVGRERQATNLLQRLSGRGGGLEIHAAHGGGILALDDLGSGFGGKPRLRMGGAHCHRCS